jgi:putative endonuclease
VYYVYILRSTSSPGQTYIGFTEDLRARFRKHNQGGCLHTAKYMPWAIAYYCAFDEKCRALDFERYLKSHSGKAFAAKRLL